MANVNRVVILFGVVLLAWRVELFATDMDLLLWFRRRETLLRIEREPTANYWQLPVGALQKTIAVLILNVKVHSGDELNHIKCYRNKIS